MPHVLTFPKVSEDSMCAVGVVSFHGLLVFGHSASDGAWGPSAGVHAGSVTPGVGEPESKLSCLILCPGHPLLLVLSSHTYGIVLIGHFPGDREARLHLKGV